MLDSLSFATMLWHVAGLFVLAWLIRRGARGSIWRGVEPAEPLPPPGFGLMVPPLIFVIGACGPALTFGLFGMPDPARLPATTAAAAALGQGISLVTTLLVAAVQFPRETRDWFGRLTPGRSIMVAFVLIVGCLPLVLRLHQFVSVWLVPYDHATLAALRDAPSAATIFWRLLHTVVMTPLFEELLYRGFVLGALMRLAAVRTFDLQRLLFGDRPSDEKPEAAGKRAPFWPVLIAALLFAAAHANQGAAPIPLFVLAVLLGESVRRTGSLMPAILTHAALNLHGTAVTLLVAP
ncbi:MAG TPA: hypothetical protein DCQ98_17110 [Planctomycetaceae bacterium]|nr:hypothetical protein [Planctomycetaceae bacterium]HRE99442.1 CPBP family intramembrane metalloprotease [Pirellulaceae bacterium]